MTDARESFLTYAERTQQEGDLEEAFRALIEFADLAPDDADVRLVLAGQLQAHERTDEAVVQLLEARATMIVAGNADQVAEVEAQIAEFAPDTPLPDAESVRARAEETTAHAAFEPDALALEGVEAAFGSDEQQAEAEPETSHEEEAAPAQEMEGLETTGLGDEPQPADDTSDVDDMAAQAAAAFGGVDAGEPETGDEDVAAHGTVEMEATEDESDDGVAEPKADAEEADDGVADDGMAELAALANAFDAGADERSDGGEADDEAVGADADQLHDILDDWAADGADATDEDEDVAEVQLMDFDTSDGESAESSSARGESMGDDWLTELTVDRRAGREEAAEQGEPADELLPSVALDVAPAPGKVEEAQYEDDLFEDDLDTAGASEAQELTVASAPAVEEDSSVAPEAPSAEPAPADDFVDLGSLVFDDAETEKTTRWFVEMADPTGDDEADFAQMLTQFKAKVAEHLEADDVRAHYDPGHRLPGDGARRRGHRRIPAGAPGQWAPPPDPRTAGPVLHGEGAIRGGHSVHDQGYRVPLRG